MPSDFYKQTRLKKNLSFEYLIVVPPVFIFQKFIFKQDKQMLNV